MDIQEIKKDLGNTVETYWSRDKLKIIGIGVLLCLLFCGAYVMFCGQNIDNGSGAEVVDDIRATGNNIQEATKQLDTVEQGIDRSTERTGNVQERINDSTKRIESVKDGNSENQELVSESIKLTAEARKIIQNLPRTNGTQNKSCN